MITLWTALLACTSSTPRSPPTTEAMPPPVVLISLDTLRADRLGAWGYTARPTSPHMDQLAREGLVFSQTQSTSPWTTPAHLSLLTGLYPAQHGVMQPYFELIHGLESDGKVAALAPERVTLAESLAAAGYRTGAFTGGGAVDPAVGLGQGFARYETDHYKLTDAHMEQLDRWLAEAPGQPFFLFWHTFEVHAPYTDTRFLGEVLDDPTQVVAGLARLDGLLRSRRPSEAHQSKAHTITASVLGDAGARTAPVTSALYDGGIAAADARVGQLMSMLKARGLYDSALIILTSDHGDEFMDHHPFFYDAHGHSLYEELVHTPLIVKLPAGAQAGQRVTQRVSLVDVAPTVLDVVGAPALSEVGGRSLRPLWAGESTEVGPRFSEALNDKRELKAIHDGTFKLIVEIPEAVVQAHGRHHLPPELTGELYDLSTDPQEAKNLWAARPDRVAALSAALRAHAAAGADSSTRVDLDPQTVQQLESMGYLEE